MKKGIMLQIASSAVTYPFASQCIPEIEALLTKFATFFVTPIGLPPCRGFEHQFF